MTDTIVEVYSALNLQQAHLVVAALDDAGIEAHVVGDRLHGAGGELPLGWATAPRIWVQQADAELSRQVIADWEAACSPNGSNVEFERWICPGCGSKVEGNFDICWNCQHAREP